MKPRFMVVALLLLGLAGSAQAVAQASGEPIKVVGTWKLVSIETLRPNGEVIYDWMGRNPAGLIIYDQTGHMAVQFMRDPRPTTIASEHMTPEEIKAAYEGYYAYFGTYEFNEKEGIVRHNIKASLSPSEVGITYKRYVKLVGDHLILTTTPFPEAGEQRTNRITFERVK
jgi:hypothetical protein